MDFETRFSNMFADETEFPCPRPLRVKRQKSFSEKFFKSSVGSTLKLRGKQALKLRQIFMSKDDVSSKKQQSPQADNEGIDKWTIYSAFAENDPETSCSKNSQIMSENVECLSISESVDSYLPESTKSSVIVLPKSKNLKIPSSNKFGTFRRSDSSRSSSPYASILKGRSNKKRPQIILNELNEMNCYTSTPLSSKLPLTPFLNFSFTSTISPSVTTPVESKANFYGQDMELMSLPRTDYSCRVSKRNIHDMNIFSFTEKTPRTLNNNGYEMKTNFSDTVDETTGLEDSSCKDNNNTINVLNGFHEELVLKCSKYKGKVQPSPLQNKRSMSLRSLNHSELSLETKPNENSKNISPTVLTKPHISVKPRLSAVEIKVPTTEVQTKCLNSVIPAKSEISRIQVPPKPDVVVNHINPSKPIVPVKPERLKITDKGLSQNMAFPLKTTPEINNNSIVLKTPQPIQGKGISYHPMYPTRKKHEKRLSLQLSSSSLDQNCFDREVLKRENSDVKSDENKSVLKTNCDTGPQSHCDIGPQSMLTATSVEPKSIPRNASKVRTLVDNFNKGLKSINSQKGSQNPVSGHDRYFPSQKYALPSRKDQAIPRKSSSEWNLTKPDVTLKLQGDSLGYGSFLDSLNQRLLNSLITESSLQRKN